MAADPPPLLLLGEEGTLEDCPPPLEEEGEDDGEPEEEDGEPELPPDGEELGGLGRPPLGLGWVITLWDRQPESSRAAPAARAPSSGRLSVMLLGLLM